MSDLDALVADLIVERYAHRRPELPADTAEQIAARRAVLADALDPPRSRRDPATGRWSR